MPDFSGFKSATSGAYIEKDPEAELTYTVDWSEWMPPTTHLQSTTFVTSTIADDPNPIVIGNGTVILDTATVIISGGSAGNIYTITNTITTDNSDTDVRRFKIKVENRFL